MTPNVNMGRTKRKRISNAIGRDCCRGYQCAYTYVDLFPSLSLFVCLFVLVTILPRTIREKRTKKDSWRRHGIGRKTVNLANNFISRKRLMWSFCKISLQGQNPKKISIAHISRPFFFFFPRSSTLSPPCLFCALILIPPHCFPKDGSAMTKKKNKRRFPFSFPMRQGISRILRF